MHLPKGSLWRDDPGRTRIKVCCIASEEEAEIALDAGADLLGLVSAMPSGPGPIPEPRIAELVRWVGERGATVLLTSHQAVTAIADQLERLHPSVVQTVDALPDEAYAQLHAAHPRVAIMQVIHVRGPESVEEGMHLAPQLDVLLLDSGNPAAAVKELGGTGRTHDWDVSRTLCRSVQIPVFLAGGLTAENVATAIETVRPFGVDVCSGVRTDGALDAKKVRQFVEAVARADGRSHDHVPLA